MGTLIYGANDTEVDLDDRSLAHLRAVIIAKLKRDESFSLTWDQVDEQKSERRSVWVDASIQIQFVFASTDRPPLNRDWVEALMATANSADGLRLVPEPKPAAERAGAVRA